MSPTKKRTKALAGGVAGAALLLAVGVAAVAHVADTGPTAPAASVVRDASAGAGDTAAPSPRAGMPAEAPPDTAPPAMAAPAAPAAKAAVPSTTATTRRAPAPSTTAAPSAVAAAAPAPTPAPAPAKPAPGQRVAYTTAGVQAAITSLHQRIPLFSPTDPQLRTFADAVCTSFDQGQTMTQVQGTVRQAVSHVQGASLSAADADFAVRVVAQLRCPGYLP
ncbi:MAG TPA: hypothetical protein VGV86_11510 [Acidimicrobiales bacterium]|nr:hypothetical protein [Acidimicrobiales bacterium]